VALLPVFNEQRVLKDVLGRVRRRVDLMVCVNDASTDASARVLLDFARTRRGVFVIDLPENRGMAGALKAGFRFVLHLAGKGIVKGDDVVVMLDADGQHEPEYIPGALTHMRAGGFDVSLMRRDLSNYPVYKVLGNRFLTLVNSVLSGVRYHDVECGFRFMKVKVLPDLLRYYTGSRYSCAQEIALLTARLGFRVDNAFPIRIPFYRHGATFWDGFIVLAMSLYTWTRWFLRLPVATREEPGLMERAFRHRRRR
jgi:glycosyltransferase involved in cell wall biosynthesis